MRVLPWRMPSKEALDDAGCQGTRLCQDSRFIYCQNHKHNARQRQEINTSLQFTIQFSKFVFVDTVDTTNKPDKKNLQFLSRCRFSLGRYPALKTNIYLMPSAKLHEYYYIYLLFNWIFSKHNLSDRTVSNSCCIICHALFSFNLNFCNVFRWLIDLLKLYWKQ